MPFEAIQSDALQFKCCIYDIGAMKLFSVYYLGTFFKTLVAKLFRGIMFFFGNDQKCEYDEALVLNGTCASGILERLRLSGDNAQVLDA